MCQPDSYVALYTSQQRFFFFKEEGVGGKVPHTSPGSSDSHLDSWCKESQSLNEARYPTGDKLGANIDVRHKHRPTRGALRAPEVRHLLITQGTQYV